MQILLDRNIDLIHISLSFVKNSILIKMKPTKYESDIFLLYEKSDGPRFVCGILPINGLRTISPESSYN